MNKDILVYGQAIVIVGLITILALQNFVFAPQSKNGFLLKEEAGSKTIEFIKNTLVEPGTQIELKNIEENSSGVYKVNFNVMGQDETVFITKDAKYLFFQTVDMKPPEPKTPDKTEKPKADLFVMSYCPYGNQAEELMMPIVNLLKDKADIELHYVIYSNYATGYPEYCLDQENQFCSMHGIQEVNQGVRELCVQKYQKDKLWIFVKAINAQATAENVDSKWEAVAQSVGLNVEQIKSCQTQEGKDLLSRELALNQASYPVQDPSKHNGQESAKIQGSPTLLINGMIYDGQRTAEAYKEAICAVFTKAPAECSQTLDNPAGDTSNSPGSCQ